MVTTVKAFAEAEDTFVFEQRFPEGAQNTSLGPTGPTRGAPLDQALEQGQAALDAGENELALEIFKEIQAQDQTNDTAIAGILRAQIALGMLAEAEEILTSLPSNIRTKADVESAASALELAKEVGETGDPAELRAKVEADPKDHQARLDLSVALFARGDACVLLALRADESPFARDGVPVDHILAFLVPWRLRWRVA